MEITVRVHFIDGTERIVPAKDIQHVGEEGARRGIALYDGKEYPIYNRIEWGFLWYEQEPLTRAALDEWDRVHQHEAELDYHMAEVELALVKDEPLSAELRTYIKPSTLRRLAEYCYEHKTSDKVVVEIVLAAFLYEQGY